MESSIFLFFYFSKVLKTHLFSVGKSSILNYCWRLRMSYNDDDDDDFDDSDDDFDD